MTDEFRKGRRAPTATERVLEEARRHQGRRNSPPLGVEALPEPIDHEMTPPPARLPSPEEMRRDDAIERLREAVGAQQAAIEHEQRVRREAKDEGRELGAIVEKLGTIATAVNALAGIDHLVREMLVPGHEESSGKLDQLLIAVEIQKQHTEDLDKQMERLFTVVGGVATRVGQVETSVTLLTQRLDAMGANLGDKQRDAADDISDLRDRVTTLEARRKAERSLTRREKGAAGGAAAVVVAVISWLVNHFT